MSLVAESPFGAALRQARVARGMSLSALSRLVSYSPGYLSRVEKGLRPPTTTLARSCDGALAAGGVLARLVPERPQVGSAYPPRPAHCFVLSFSLLIIAQVPLCSFMVVFALYFVPFVDYYVLTAHESSFASCFCFNPNK